MSILGDAVVIGSGGETATIVLTVPHGATAVSCTTPAGVVLTGVCVVGTDTDVYTFARLKVYGSYVCSATQSGTTKTQTVVVDAAETIAASIVFYPTSSLFWLGDEREAVTGGWVTYKPVSTWAQGGTASIDTALNLATTADYTGIGYATINKVDFSGYSYLKAHISSISSDQLSKKFYICTSSTKYQSEAIAYAQIASTGDIAISVSNYQGLYYVCFAVWQGPGCAASIDKIWLE